MQGISVKLRNPAEVSMLLTENLLEYLVSRTKTLAKFAFGDWLATLSDPQLQHLLDLIDIVFGADEEGDPQTDDLAGVALIGSEAEKNRRPVGTHQALKAVWESIADRPPEEVQELFGRVFWAVSLERFRRQEFMEIKGKLRIHPFPSDKAVVTEKGIAYGISVKSRFH